MYHFWWMNQWDKSRSAPSFYPIRVLADSPIPKWRELAVFWVIKVTLWIFIPRYAIIQIIAGYKPLNSSSHIVLTYNFDTSATVSLIFFTKLGQLGVMFTIQGMISSMNCDDCSFIRFRKRSKMKCLENPGSHAVTLELVHWIRKHNIFQS